MERKMTFAILAIVAVVGLAVSAVASNTAFAQGQTNPGLGIGARSPICQTPGTAGTGNPHDFGQTSGNPHDEIPTGNPHDACRGS
jgi:hypothetical protein